MSAINYLRKKFRSTKTERNNPPPANELIHPSFGITETDKKAVKKAPNSLLFLMYALDSGVVFRPLLSVISENIEQGANVSFDTLYFYITDSLTMMAIVAGKYIILLLCMTICCGYVDLFFKKASLSISISADIKAITVIIILNLWLLQDQFYVFKKIMEKAGYE